MTNEEAIMILKAMIDEMILVFDRDRKKALNMAIEALKEQPEHSQNTPQKQPDPNTLGIKTDETCEDVISRQDAIGLKLTLSEVQTNLRKTPSAQPEPLEGRTVMGDLISRQAAIDVVRRCSVKEVAPAYMLIDKAEVMTELMMLPSAQPERKRGMWKVIRYNGDMQRYARCKCGYEYGAGKFDGLKFVALKLHNFCPNCGAKMEVEE